MADEVTRVQKFDEEFEKNDKKWMKDLARHRRFVVYRIIIIVAAIAGALFSYTTITKTWFILTIQY